MRVRSLASASAAPPARQPLHLDPLTQVLEGIRLRCMIPGVTEMTAPWGVKFGGVSPQELRRHIESLGLPVPHHFPLIRGSLIALVRGSCWLEMEEHDIQVPLVGGDLVLLTRNSPFTLRDDLRSPVKHITDLLRREHLERQASLRHGGGGAPTTYLNGGFFFEDEQDNPLLAALPPLIHLRGEQGRCVPWLENTLKFLVQELTLVQPGAQSIINHLVHVLFIQAVRAYCASAAEDGAAGGLWQKSRWFRALLDEQLAPALGQMHLHPEHPWTVALLAEQAGLSRSAFAAKFMATIGHPPLQYLTDCRMRKARTLLRDGRLGVKGVAAKVGYATESAFSNAFKRATGLAPGVYRRAAAGGHPPAPDGVPDSCAVL